MGSVVGRILQDQLELEQTPEIELASSPGPMMYAGSFSEALVSVEGFEVAGVKPDRIVMDFDPCNVNIVESATSGELSTEKPLRSEEHTSELQSRQYLVCRLLLEKKTKEIKFTLL